MGGYGDWSLTDLKTTVAGISTDDLTAAAQHAQRSATQIETTQSGLQSAMSNLATGWQGKAAQAAVQDAIAKYDTMDQTRATADQFSQQTHEYVSQVQAQKAQMAAVPDVDTSWGAAARASGGNILDLPVQKVEAQRRYNNAQTDAARIAQQMDDAGYAHARTVSDPPYPPPTLGVDPPSSIPPPPGRAGDRAEPEFNAPRVSGGGGTSTVVPGGTPPGRAAPPKTVVGGPGKKTRPGKNPPEAGPPSEAPPGKGGPSGAEPPVLVDPGGNPVNPTSVGPGANGSGGVSGSAGTTGAGPREAGSSLPGGLGGAGAAAGVLGGAGLLAAGGLSGRGAPAGTGSDGTGGARAAGEENLGDRGVSGGAAGEEDLAGRGLSGRGLSGGAAGEDGLSGRGLTGRGLSGGAAGEDGLPGRGLSDRGGLGGAGEEGLGGRGLGGPRGLGGSGGLGEQEYGGQNPRVRTGAGTDLFADEHGAHLPGGVAGEPVAGEAGSRMPYGGGGRGARRDDDEEAARLPDYLVETDDIWGDGVIAAPPVLGE